MRQLTWNEMRRTARSQLLAYRQNSLSLRRHNMEARAPSRAPARRTMPPAPSMEEVAEIRLWKKAIDAARATARKEDPLLERFMVRYFAMRVPKNRRQSECARNAELSAELHISESTLYKWKERILQLVIAAAVQSGAMLPFDME